MIQVSFYREGIFDKKGEERAISSILEDISTGKYKHQVDNVRAQITSGNVKGADDLKKRLPGFTPSGIFTDGRRAEQLTEYSRILVLDLDDLGPRLGEVKEGARKMGFTYACFVSPSGNGLKILVKVNSSSESHREAFAQVASHYEAALNVTVDPSGKDVNRLCFCSDDPKTFINEDSDVFEVKKSGGAIPASASAEKYERAVELTRRKFQFVHGSRNSFVHLLANNCNRLGIPEVEAASLIQRDYDYDTREVTSTIRSAYAHIEQHGAESYSDDPDEDRLMNTPTIPAEVYERMPRLLREGANAFDTPRQKDLFLTGAFPVLSGCMSSVTGLYSRKTVHANLFTFGIASAASGKGAMGWGKELGMKIHNKLLEEGRSKREKYAKDSQAYKKSPPKGTQQPDPPVKPKCPLLFFPGNTSSAAIIKHLDQSDGKGIMVESEADTIATALKQDWGGYSDMLRKAFHHEPITFSRKNNEEYIEITSPQLSVGLSGTPSQVRGLIQSPEDGLFSRFIFYRFEEPQKWMDASPNAGVDLEGTFKRLSEEVEKLYTTLQNRKIRFDLTGPQWKMHFGIFADWLSDATNIAGPDAASTIKRLGLITYRFAMVLSVVRGYEKGTLGDTIICEDVDFQNALDLAVVYKEHALSVLSTLKGSRPGPISKYEMQFLSALPNDREFTRAEAVSIGEQVNIKERTVGKHLKRLTLGYLHSPKHGVYRKNA